MSKRLSRPRVALPAALVALHALYVLTYPSSTRPSPGNPAAAVATNPNRTLPVYTEELAKVATRPGSWRCAATRVGRSPDGDIDGGEVFAFVHVYKTAGTTMRNFFSELAHACRRTWISLARCTGVLPSSIRSRGTWKPCTVTEVVDGRGRGKKAAQSRRGGKKGGMSNPRIEGSVDIFGGHIRLGTGDYVSNPPPSFARRASGGVRYIRYVSGILYQNKVRRRVESMERVVNRIKEQVANARENDRYWDKSLDYLLTPAQRESKTNGTSSTTAASPSSSGAEARAMLAIENLHKYNVIVGMTERMPESLDILRHVFLPRSEGAPEGNTRAAEADAVFEKFGITHSSGGDGGAHRANKSTKKDVSTSAVIAELAKDEGHVLRMEEYVKYERMITDFAWTMHNLQYDCLMARARAKEGGGGAGGSAPRVFTRADVRVGRRNVWQRRRGGPVWGRGRKEGRSGRFPGIDVVHDDGRAAALNATQPRSPPIPIAPSSSCRRLRQD
ncbi:hypothetical protein ACHAW5_008772 [Stephanodiscus triporus]|uniref:Uncharacterized protein n=1 Tax=Stephanodiscus triporus TaxID=2934178 RepID=A0ABD3P7H3_9STRA